MLSLGYLPQTAGSNRYECVLTSDAFSSVTLYELQYEKMGNTI